MRNRSRDWLCEGKGGEKLACEVGSELASLFSPAGAEVYPAFSVISHTLTGLSTRSVALDHSHHGVEVKIGSGADKKKSVFHLFRYYTLE